MIFGNNGWQVSSPLRLMIVLVALGVFPLGFFQATVQAQDFEAVERRLGGAVEAGEISLEQALVMMKALWRASEEAEMERKHHFMEMEREIDAAVRAGKMSPEEARDRINDLKAELFGEDEEDEDYDHEHGDHEHEYGDREHEDGDRDHEEHGHDHEDGDREVEPKKQRYMEAARKIEAAVEAGRISEEDGKARLIEMRTAMFRSPATKGKGDMEAKKRRYMEAAEKIKAMVEEGKVSEEAGEQRLLQMRKAMFGQDDSKKGEGSKKDMEAERTKFMKMAEEVETAVKEGEISPENARRRLARIRAGIAQLGESKNDSASQEKKEGDADAMKRRYQAGAERIKAAIESGRLSEEDGKKRLIEMRKAMSEKDRD